MCSGSDCQPHVDDNYLKKLKPHVYFHRRNSIIFITWSKFVQRVKGIYSALFVS